MRATKHQHSENTTSAQHQAAASRKSRKAIKATSVGCAAMLAAAVLVIPTTTLAPGVEAYADSRTASYAVGDAGKFSSVIADNCSDATYVNKANVVTKPTIPATTVQPTTAAAKKAATASSTKATTPKTATIAVAPKSVAAVSASTGTAKTASTKSVSAAPATQSSKSSSSSSAVSYNYDDDYDYDYSYSYYDDDDDYSSYYYYEDDDDDYYYSGSSSSSAGSGSQLYSSGALISISNPDYSYSATHISLSSYDRAKLERLVMGEAGTMGYNGCAVVAQAIRDSMVRSRTTSIDYIIDEYQYYGSTSVQPNADVKAAVSFIFDQDGIAVQHRVMCFYIGYSSWHETQTFLTEIQGVRFFDLNVA